MAMHEAGFAGDSYVFTTHYSVKYPIVFWIIVKQTHQFATLPKSKLDGGTGTGNGVLPRVRM